MTEKEMDIEEYQEYINNGLALCTAAVEEALSSIEQEPNPLYREQCALYIAPLTGFMTALKATIDKCFENVKSTPAPRTVLTMIEALAKTNSSLVHLALNGPDVLQQWTEKTLRCGKWELSGKGRTRMKDHPASPGARSREASANRRP